MHEPINYLPVDRLQKYIASYGVLEIPEGLREPYFSPPIALSGMIIQAIDSEDIMIAKINGDDFFNESAVVTGQVTAPVYGEFLGPMKSLLIFFHPLGMHQLFGTDMATLTNKSRLLGEFLDTCQADDLLSKLKTDQNTDHQIQVLNEFFMGINPVDSDTTKLEPVLDFIHEKRGGVTVNEILSEGHYHRKTLERQFQKMIGLSPKVYIQIYRFKCLINLIQSHPGITWTQLADQAGYYDQSHMSRYVKEYLQVSPNSIVQLDMEFINYLLRR